MAAPGITDIIRIVNRNTTQIARPHIAVHEFAGKLVLIHAVPVVIIFEFQGAIKIFGILGILVKIKAVFAVFGVADVIARAAHRRDYIRIAMDVLQINLLSKTLPQFLKV